MEFALKDFALGRALGQEAAQKERAFEPELRI